MTMTVRPPVAAPARRIQRPTPPETIARLRAAQAGDRDAFGCLYQSYRDLVTRYVTVRMRDYDRHAIEDVVHDTFADALAALPAAHDDVPGWFLQRAARACTIHFRFQGRYLRAAHTLYDQASRTGTSAVVPTRRGTWLMCVQVLARLNADQRRPVQLRFLDGASRPAVARAMDRTTSAVTGLERRTLQRLRAEIDTHGSDGSGDRRT